MQRAADGPRANRSVSSRITRYPTKARRTSSTPRLARAWYLLQKLSELVVDGPDVMPLTLQQVSPTAGWRVFAMTLDHR